MTSENEDRLSSLPQDIRSHILSLMPTKFAARTSILSQRWRHSWMFVTDLNFDEIEPIHYIDSFTQSVDRVLQFYTRSQLNLFRLRFTRSCVFEKCLASWIDKAVWLNVLEIDIHIHLHDLPLSFFTCKTLSKLKLDWCAYQQGDLIFPYSVNLPCMKTLDVVCSKPVAGAFKLIHGCPVLENLYLEVPYFYNNEEDYVFDIPTLKRLKLTVLRGLIITNKVVLNVPNLEYLFVGGTLCSLFVMEDVLSLVEASLLFCDVTNGHLWVELLKGVSGVKSLSVQYVSVFIDFGNPFSSPLPIFLNLTHLELKGFWDYGVISEVLKGSPLLKHLSVEKKHDFDGLLKPESYEWIESKLVPVCMLTNLTTINFSKCKKQHFDIGFLEYMIRNAKVVKMVRVAWKMLPIKEGKRLCENLNKVPKASSCCEIHYLGRCSPCPRPSN